ncbi:MULTISPECIES: GntR family transcriptional regulator [Pseudomonas]|uniref:GntR family transcriptional regulator n=1 Tax=Pseudomonas TaxID=286 RepID=UPI0002E8E22B|nr:MULTISPECIES: GntR family transcriptional regulator [unclassified Pseudomonas]MBD9613688.1 GntR family transcriptional regulator [Pseudomonas sp. PDM02]MCP1519086.1 DNA-binding GntR family transcriptional regulator [Pseudomonas migulae]
MTVHKPIDKGNLSERVYSIIRTALMDGQYQPGDRLRISTLAEEFGVSITPVREAIFRLVSDHALDMKAATSIYVPELTVSQLREIQLIRHLLEGEAAGVAAQRITQPELEKLEAIQDAFQKAVSVDYKQAALLNREFHFGLISAARMPVVSKTLENMWVIMGPLLSRFHAEVPKRELASAKHKHFEVLDGLRTRDSAKAKDAMQADIAWGELMIDWLEKKENLAEA